MTRRTPWWLLAFVAGTGVFALTVAVVFDPVGPEFWASHGYVAAVTRLGFGAAGVGQLAVAAHLYSHRTKGGGD